MAAVDIRVPVGAPLILTGTPPVGERWHPLGAGVKRKKAYPSMTFGPLALPASGPSLDYLRAMLIEPIPGLPQHLTTEAWKALLSSAPLVADAPLDEDGGAELFGSVAGGRLRRVVLGAVLEDGSAAGQRLGAVAQLSVLLEADDNVPRDARLRADWVPSTRGMLAAFDKIPGLVIGEPDGPRVTVLLSEYHALMDPRLPEAIERTGRMAGLKTVVHSMSGSMFGNISDIVMKTPPSHLILAGADLPRSLGDRFAADRGPNRLHHLRSEAPAELLETLREQLAVFAGVGPGLTSHVVEAAPAGRPVMPLSGAAECMHLDDVVYVRDVETDLWWTRDHAHHAGAVFKTYQLKGNTLTWVNDHNADGSEYVGKNKGEDTRELSTTGAHSCHHLDSHL